VKVQATWYEEISADNYQDMPPDPHPFNLGVRYRANIRLTAKAGWRFIQGRDFTCPDDVTITHHETGAAVRHFEVTYGPAASATVVSDLNLTPYITKPTAGGTPVLAFTGTQYSGVVEWKNTGTREVLIGPFQPGAAYTAEIALSPGPGRTFTGLGEDAFVHTGAADLASPAGGGFVTLTFPPTPEAGGLTVVYDTILTGLLPKPVDGVTPAAGIAGPQFSGTVTWTPAHTAFRAGTSYRAALTLKAAPGYTFTGIGQNVFTHGDAPGAVTNPAGSGTVTVTFSAAPPLGYQVMSFGPLAATNSALALLKERSAVSNQVVVDLPGGSEDVPYSAVLEPYDTSPVNVVIDGHGRTLTKTSPGSLITVGTGVTLILQNITLQGCTNDAQLITVLSGGTLTLRNGAALTGNRTSADAGGIRVNGGVLIMHNGAAIRRMEAQRAGGVLIDGGGSFIMTDGTIGGTDPDDGNSAAASGGGGVLVDNGSFDMYGGTIQCNTAKAEYSGGGVAVTTRDGNFTHHAGTIMNNIARAAYSGGGVYNYSDQCTITGTAVIAGNIAEGDFSGGGVYAIDNSSINIEGGTIRGNTARGASSGGGVWVYGHLAMYGGLITENIAGGASSGGGAYVLEGSFYGGTVAGNIAKEPDSGGGIYTRGGLGIYGAIIEGNRAEGADSGGGIYVGDNMIFDIRRGTIQGNTALGPASAGGIYISSSGSGYLWNDDMMSGDITIKANSASWNGSGGESAGAIYIAGWNDNAQREGRLSMIGGTIGGPNPQDANTAVKGVNGVYVAGTFDMGGGEIKGNTKSGSNNYGVYVDRADPEAFTMHEDARVDAGNLVFLADGAFIDVSYLNSGGSGTIANITCANPRSYTAHNEGATKLLYAHGSGSAGGDLIDSVKHRFLFNGNNINMQTTGTYVDAWTTYYYGYYEP
jgi:hypothetical protein